MIFNSAHQQTLLGYNYSHFRNNLGMVDDVQYFRGATVVNETKRDKLGWGATLGNYINSRNIDMNNLSEDHLLRHEYGHMLQSRLLGSNYLQKVMFQSLIGSGLGQLGLHDHSNEWYETGANRMSLRYFSKHEKDALNRNEWDFDYAPTTYKLDWYWVIAHPGLLQLPYLIF
jgi:hypothetical protein